ncbi:hypothetical protein SLS63_007743 [Diaporthe eres]|uniref:NmrA-like domain-containing protein n=1 Tax=Diaporthe eres TaxID=83184 RepID=A0ABR1P4U3_DIAER
MAEKEPRVIAVLGATGNQGRGVVKALLDSPHNFQVRAITRDPASQAAQDLLALVSHHEGLRLVRGDVYDTASLLGAFEGAHGVFAMTQNHISGKMFDKEEDLRHELEAGRNIVDAARGAGVGHFVFSSLPDITGASGGRYPKVYHFDFKHQIDQWARQRLPAVTTLIPAVFEAGPERTASKTYPIGSSKISFGEMPAIFSRVTGAPARFESISLEEWTSTVVSVAGKGFEEDIRQMVQWVRDAPADKICYGTMDPAADSSWEDLGVRASTFEEWILRNKWMGP